MPVARNQQTNTMNIYLFKQEKSRTISNDSYAIQCDIVLQADDTELCRVKDALSYECRRRDGGKFTRADILAAENLEDEFEVTFNILEDCTIQDTIQRQSIYLLDPQMVDALTDEFYENNSDEYREFLEFFKPTPTAPTNNN